MATIFRDPLIRELPSPARREHDWAAQDLLNTTLAPVPLVSQLDWPNPRGQQYPSELRTWLQSHQQGYLAKPFQSGDWPNPGSVNGRLDTNFANLLNTTLVPGIVTFPFSQQDWPNPIYRLDTRKNDDAYNLSIYQSPVAVVFVDWITMARRHGRR